MRIYLDHNVIIYISNGKLPVFPIDDVAWLYSDEHLAEIRRSGNTDPLGALRDLKARRIRLQLDELKITDNATIDEYRDPAAVYDESLSATSGYDGLDTLFDPLLTGLMGGNVGDALRSLPRDIKTAITSMLEPLGLPTEAVITEIEALRPQFVRACQQIAESGGREEFRNAVGLEKGRTGNMPEKTAIPMIWDIIKDRFPGTTIDQFFGFDPPDKQGYATWPKYLGIVSCHVLLNMAGFAPDKGLSRVDRMPSVRSDAVHAAMAAFCHLFLSADKKLCSKARAIYSYLGIGTRVALLKFQDGRT